VLDGPQEDMSTSEVKGNQEFARWFGKRTKESSSVVPRLTRQQGLDAYSMTSLMMKRIHAGLRLLSTLLLAVLALQGCNALNPLCGSARPAPSISSLSDATITFAQVQQGFLLTVNGSHIVSSSVAVINGTTLSTQVLSSSQLQVTLTTATIMGPGTASVAINTPGGNTSAVGCTSGGTSKALTLTIT